VAANSASAVSGAMTGSTFPCPPRWSRIEASSVFHARVSSSGGPGSASTDRCLDQFSSLSCIASGRGCSILARYHLAPACSPQFDVIAEEAGKCPVDDPFMGRDDRAGTRPRDAAHVPFGVSFPGRPPSWHRLGPLHMPLEAKRCRQRAVAVPRRDSRPADSMVRYEPGVQDR
jgi:hypothetical protein